MAGPSFLPSRDRGATPRRTPRRTPRPAARFARRVGGGLLWLALAAPVFVACAAPGPTPEERARARAAEEERVRRAAEDWLRALFPEVQGEITRAAIAHALVVEAPVEPQTGDVPAAAIAAVRRGDYARARGLLGELVTQNEVTRAKELLSRGDDRGAIAVLDRAVATAPDSPELRLMRAEAALSVATRDGDTTFARAALEDFEEAARKHGGPRSFLGASRAAQLLGRPDPALTYARSGLDALDGAELALSDSITPERVWAQACLAAFADSPAGQGAQGGAGGALASETITALRAAIARAPEDPWAWRRLAALESERLDAATARRTARRGLQFFPKDEELHTVFARVVRESGGDGARGSAALRDAYAEFLTRNPDVARAHFEHGEARLDLAIDALARDPASADGDAPAFAAAESDFARCAELEPARAEACGRRRAVCRTGAGFARLARGDRDGARTWFLSVEDVSPGGLRLGTARLRSGLEGLVSLAQAYAGPASTSVTRDATSTTPGRDATSPSNDPASPTASGRDRTNTAEDLERAARIDDYLRQYEPTNAAWAAQSGRRHRDAAIATEIAARRAGAAGRFDEASALLARARESMEASRSAFDDAVKLAPNDPRVALEAGLVLTQWLQRDPTTARARLEAAVTSYGERRESVAATARDAGGEAAVKARRELEEIDSGLADAYQALGVLELTLNGDPTAARAWFARCVATSPDPREDVRGKGGWIERCDAAIADGSDTRVRPESRWAAPTPPR